jgi:fructoselysine-6-P-deglycase FrlB-like protein
VVAPVVTQAAAAVSPAAIFDEMRRQAGDARRSFAENGEVAGQIADAARRSGRLLLFGMGGSHAVNRVAEPLYRAVGIDTNALVASEALNATFPTRGATVLLNSQSGESGEIVAYLARKSSDETLYGLTLNAGSTLARAALSLVGHGGMEQAFAATRSLLVSLALHARVLHDLGELQDRIVEAATRREVVPFDAAVQALTPVEAVIVSGRAAMQGVAEAAALGFLELARMPSFALEGGQLRHGPVEALGPRLGVIFVRQAQTGPVPDSTPALVEICVGGGSPTVVFDLSGAPPIAGAVTIAFPGCAGLEAAMTVLPTMQRFLIEVARSRVDEVGVPLRSSKVTRET